MGFIAALSALYTFAVPTDSRLFLSSSCFISIFYYFSNTKMRPIAVVFLFFFARVLLQQPKLVRITLTMLLLHMPLSQVECIISPTKGLRLVAGPSHPQLSRVPLPV